MLTKFDTVSLDLKGHTPLYKQIKKAWFKWYYNGGKEVLEEQGLDYNDGYPLFTLGAIQENRLLRDKPHYAYADVQKMIARKAASIAGPEKRAEPAFVSPATLPAPETRATVASPESVARSIIDERRARRVARTAQWDDALLKKLGEANDRGHTTPSEISGYFNSQGFLTRTGRLWTAKRFRAVIEWIIRRSDVTKAGNLSVRRRRSERRALAA